MKNTMTTSVLVLSFLLASFQLNAQGSSDCVADNQQFRKTRNQWIKTSPETPFDPSDLDEFNGLYYYPIDCDLQVEGMLKPNATPQKVNVSTTDGGSVSLIDYGTVKVRIKDVEYELKVYKNIDMPEFAEFSEAYFIPFRDATSAAPYNTTFAEGRYLMVQLPAQGKKVVLDMNMAINPFANYNSTFSSLVTPGENVIAAPLQAGERKYEDR